ncbi:MAG: hypothetical protein VZR53_12610 [Prevotella sp.]|nr:hypothetical protein [Prevotella sp.]
MSISSLFAGMEAYLDGDVEINNNVGTPEGDAEDAEVAEQTAEVASDTADASEEAKDNEVASQMLGRMYDMYAHVKQFGIDRTFVSLYNRHGELDRVCGMRFPSCESMDVVGDRYSMYSTAFIAAMESSGSGLFAKIKAFILKIWKWIKETVSSIWNKILSIFGFKKNRVKQAAQALMNHKGLIAGGAAVIAAATAGVIFYRKHLQSKELNNYLSIAQKYLSAIKAVTTKDEATTKALADLKGQLDKAENALKEAFNKLAKEKAATEGGKSAPADESFSYDTYSLYGYPGLEAEGADGSKPAADGTAAESKESAPAPEAGKAVTTASAEQDKFIARNKKAIEALRKISEEVAKLAATPEKGVPDADTPEGIKLNNARELQKSVGAIIGLLTNASQKETKAKWYTQFINAVKKFGHGLRHPVDTAKGWFGKDETPDSGKGDAEKKALFNYNFL